MMIVGQKWLAVELLRQCRREGHAVAAVAGVPGDRLLEAAAVEGVRSVAATGALDPAAVPAGVDVILCAHAHGFVPAAARQRARFGALGFHPSLLPRHRGRDAVRWTLHMREPVAGGSLYWLDDGADTGPVALQDWCHVRPGDTPAGLWRRELAPMALRLFSLALGLLEAGGLPAVPQDAALATWEPAFAAGPLVRG